MIKILISLDTVSRSELSRVVEQTKDLNGVCGYKIGALCSLALGLGEVIRTIRAVTPKQIVYDHQKAGNDIPEIARKLVQLTAECGVNAFILFPFAGPATLLAAVQEGLDRGLTMIVGAHMTHPSFTYDDGGFVRSSEITRIFQTAASLGVRDFVLPGNQPDVAAKYADELSRRIEMPTFWAPGFGRQGGVIGEFSRRLAGKGYLVPIVGRSVYEAADPASEVERLCTV